VSDPAPEPLSPGVFGESLHAFLRASLALAPATEPELTRRLREHLGVEELSALPVLGRELPAREHPNLQLAFERLLERDGWSAEVIGVGSGGHWEPPSLAGIATAARAIGGDRGIRPGALTLTGVRVGPGEVISCWAGALLLLHGDGRRLAALVTRGERAMGDGVRVEVLADERAAGDALLAELARLMAAHNVYRGRVLAFSRTEEGEVELEVRTLPSVPRDAIVLPAGVLDRIERHVLGPVRHRERLLAAGRHLKRGVLLHGPPGTGKTMTATYLVGRLPGRTTVILNGEGYGLIEPACELARELAPATVILEDVDLVGHERAFGDPAAPLLFELLNQMDGLAEDADLLFLLTTNRPDALEPALAARPGRIDQAVELPLPDADGLLALLTRYGEGLEVRADLAAFAAPLAGASAAHVKELLRKATLLAAEEREESLVVEDRHLRAALEDLVVGTGEVRASLFDEAPPEAAFPFPAPEHGQDG